MTDNKSEPTPTNKDREVSSSANDENDDLLVAIQVSFPANRNGSIIVDKYRLRDFIDSYLTRRLEEAKLQARGDERDICLGEIHPMFRGTVRGTNAIDEPTAIGGATLSDEDRGWNQGTLHVLKMIEEKHYARIAELFAQERKDV